MAPDTGAQHTVFSSRPAASLSISHSHTARCMHASTDGRRSSPLHRGASSVVPTLNFHMLAIRCQLPNVHHPFSAFDLVFAAFCLDFGASCLASSVSKCLAIEMDKHRFEAFLFTLLSMQTVLQYKYVADIWTMNSEPDCRIYVDK